MSTFCLSALAMRGVCARTAGGGLSRFSGAAHPAHGDLVPAVTFHLPDLGGSFGMRRLLSM